MYIKTKMNLYCSKVQTLQKHKVNHCHQRRNRNPFTLFIFCGLPLDMDEKIAKAVKTDFVGSDFTEEL